MRLFIAIELPDEVRRHLLHLQDDLKLRISNASFTRDQNLHITLKFLGETGDQQMAQLADSLGKVTVGGAVEIFAERIDCFPDRGPVRIIAAEFGGAVGGLTALHRAIEQRCQHLGFQREARQYRPHVTLARARPILPPAVRPIVQQSLQGHLPGPGFVVREFSLMESHLRPQGAEYRTLARFAL